MRPDGRNAVPELESARALLPAWAGLGAGLWLAPICLCIGWAAARVAAAAALPSASRWRASSWPERARLCYPGRLATALAAGVGAAATGACAALEPGLFSWLPPWGEAVLCAACAWVGGEAVALDVGRRTSGNPALGLRGELAGLLLLAPALIPLAWMLAFVRSEWSAAGATAAAVGIAGFAAAGIWAGVPLLCLLGAARRADARVQQIVQRAAARAGVTPRAVFEIELSAANAFALPLPRWLLFTRRCAEGLSDAELEALAAHELGHLAESPRVALARVAGALALVPVGFARVFVESLGPLPGMLAISACVLALALPITRARVQLEREADLAARRGELDPGLFARALARLGELNALPAVGFGRGGSHPHLYDRLLAGGVTPAFARPAPPSALRLFAGTGAMIALLLVALPLALQPRIPLWFAVRDSGLRAALSIALTGGSTRDLYDLALDLSARGRTHDALVAIAALQAISPGNFEYEAWRAELLASVGRCSEALPALARAQAWAGPAAAASTWVGAASDLISAACQGAARPAAFEPR